jgi:hypothetical protein
LSAPPSTPARSGRAPRAPRVRVRSACPRSSAPLPGRSPRTSNSTTDPTCAACTGAATNAKSAILPTTRHQIQDAKRRKIFGRCLVSTSTLANFSMTLNHQLTSGFNQCNCEEVAWFPGGHGHDWTFICELRCNAKRRSW